MKYEVPIYYECLSTVTVEADSVEVAYQKIMNNICCMENDCADVQKIFASKEYKEGSMEVDGGVDSVVESK